MASATDSRVAAAQADVSTRVPVDVSAGVLVRADGQVLFGQRPASKVYAGYWEFPGGKVEPGESTREALIRELHEELDIRVETLYPWITQVFVYPHATVRLHFFRVIAWHGEPRAKEHQALAWSAPGGAVLEPMLPANAPVLKGLQLPDEYAVSNASATGAAVFLTRLARRLESGLRLIHLREKTMDAMSLAALATQTVRLCHAHGARLLVNNDESLARAVGADGVHLTAERLHELNARPAFDWVGASCHTREELDRAADLGLDFAVVGPVDNTPTHPGTPALGWQGFEALVSGCRLPVYAIGGLQRADLDRAWSCGAHGIAMIRGSWR